MKQSRKFYILYFLQDVNPKESALSVSSRRQSNHYLLTTLNLSVNRNPTGLLFLLLYRVCAAQLMRLMMMNFLNPWNPFFKSLTERFIRKRFMINKKIRSLLLRDLNQIPSQVSVVIKNISRLKIQGEVEESKQNLNKCFLAKNTHSSYRICIEN